MAFFFKRHVEVPGQEQGGEVKEVLVEYSIVVKNILQTLLYPLLKCLYAQLHY